MLSQTIKKVKNSKEMIVPADKSPLLYKIPVQEYQQMWRNEATKDYKKSNQIELNKVNKLFLDIIEKYEPGLEIRI